MAESPSISILMGIYNCASTLKEAVDCILAQTCCDWELIMCDDASSDGTYQKAIELSENNDKIKVIRNDKNMGLSFALNRCLNLAEGEYVARMDGDDICAADRLEKELHLLESRTEFVLVSCLMKIFDENGEYGEVPYEEYPQPQSLVYNSPFCHAASMMKRSVLQQLGGYSTTAAAERVEDYDLWARLYEAGYRGYNIQEPLYSMRDDRNAYKRRKFKYRVNEFRVKRNVYRSFHLPKMCYFQVFKPICVGLLPEALYTRLHKNRLK